ncbi:hypothetical protein TIFTF001_025794 [Ficus carica]|uniref:Uncharacterized protein n=1 Tax=Ficus carica TaxID=3494 RepID=A0AA88AZ45_FICCA|nr:hypothetical protein TIFTF001_025794 [Ficus carica]
MHEARGVRGLYSTSKNRLYKPRGLITYRRAKQDIGCLSSTDLVLTICACVFLTCEMDIHERKHMQGKTCRASMS